MRHTARSTWALVLCVAVAAGLAGTWLWSRDQPDVSDPVLPDPWFKDQAAEAGLDFVYRSGHTGRHWFPEIIGGGVCLLDVDGDDRLDVYFVQGGHIDPQRAGEPRPGNQLFRNRGDGSFEDISLRSGAGDTGYGMGCTAADYDGDGDTDLHVTNVGPNVLLQNNGAGVFEDVTAAAGVGHPGWGTSSAFFDADGDQDLDLFVVNYIVWSAGSELACTTAAGHPDYCSPANYDAPAVDVLYINGGNGTFEDATESAGLGAAYGNGLGIAVADFDADGRNDIFVANDATPNQLWLANGDGTFRDEALLAGCAVNGNGTAEAGMGVHAMDVDADADFDLVLTHLDQETHTVYRNDGGWFSDATMKSGLGPPSVHATGFGVGVADFDHDGRLDCFVANGRVMRPGVIAPRQDVYAETNQLFAGTNDGFRTVAGGDGMPAASHQTSRGTAFGDLDGDGGIDIVVVNRDAPVQLLVNNASSRGHWAAYDVIDAQGRIALGTIVQITVNGMALTRGVERAYSYCSSNSPRVHFGLGRATEIDAVRVIWPDGTQQSFEGHAADAVQVLQQDPPHKGLETDPG